LIEFNPDLGPDLSSHLDVASMYLALLMGTSLLPDLWRWQTNDYYM